MRRDEINNISGKMVYLNGGGDLEMLSEIRGKLDDVFEVIRLTKGGLAMLRHIDSDEIIMVPSRNVESEPRALFVGKLRSL